MHELQHYRIDYRINGQADFLTLDEYSEPTLDRARLQILLKHQQQPKVLEDAPWEQPLRPSLESSAEEAGISDIRIQRLE